MSDSLSQDKAIELITNNSFEFFLDMNKSKQMKVNKENNYIKIYSGVPHPILNGVLDTQFSSENIQGQIDEAMKVFKDNNMPIMWYVWPSSQPNDLRQQLLDYGLSHAADNPGMLADFSTLPEEMSLADGVRIELVTNNEMMEDWKFVLKEGFQMPDMVMDFFLEVYKEIGHGEGTPTQHYLAYLDDKPVACGTIYLGTNNVCGIWNIATLEEARGKGIGTAITWKPCFDAMQKGYKYGVLLSSEMGYGVYKRLGFEEYCKVGYYAWAPEE